MNLLTIIRKKGNTTETAILPNPSKMQVTIQDWDASTSERNANGDLMRDRVTTKRKIEVEYSYLTGAEMSGILTATEDVFFDVVYFDPKDNAMRQMTAYIGDRTPSFYILQDNKVAYRDFKFSLIEK